MPVQIVAFTGVCVANVGPTGCATPSHVTKIFHPDSHPSRQLVLLACIIFPPVPTAAANEGIEVLAILQVDPASVEYLYSIVQLLPGLPPVAAPDKVSVVPEQTVATAGFLIPVVGASARQVPVQTSLGWKPFVGTEASIPVDKYGM